MAGYGTDIEAPTWSDGLIKTLLRAAQVRAQRLETLEMHYRKRSEVDQITTWDMWIDGSGWMIAAWSQQLERELPIVAEGYANLPKARSVRIARSLVTRWHERVLTVVS